MQTHTDPSHQASSILPPIYYPLATLGCFLTLKQDVSVPIAQPSQLLLLLCELFFPYQQVPSSSLLRFQLNVMSQQSPPQKQPQSCSPILSHLPYRSHHHLRFTYGLKVRVRLYCQPPPSGRHSKALLNILG